MAGHRRRQCANIEAAEAVARLMRLDQITCFSFLSVKLKNHYEHTLQRSRMSRHCSGCRLLWTSRQCGRAIIDRQPESVEHRNKRQVNWLFITRLDSKQVHVDFCPRSYITASLWIVDYFPWIQSCSNVSCQKIYTCLRHIICLQPTTVLSFSSQQLLGKA